MMSRAAQTLLAGRVFETPALKSIKKMRLEEDSVKQKTLLKQKKYFFLICIYKIKK